ncbi:phage major capsid protein [Microbacterium foliorum]|uniref:phage major capsid protein n=1 Tax=Rothia terrae TaxID=396015 RepID=UPI003428AF37
MSITTNLDLKSLFPDIVDPRAVEHGLVRKTLIDKITTFTIPCEGDVPSVLVPYAPLEPEVGFVKEGAEIPSAEAQLHEAVIHTGKVATIQELSWEAIRQNYQPGVAYEQATDPIATNAVANSTAGKILLKNLSNAIARKTNDALLNNTSPLGAKGLLTLEGIQDAGTLEEGNLDAISDAISMVEAELGTPTHIVIDPLSWGKLRKTKTAANAGTLLLGSAVDETPSTLFGVEVVVAPEMPKGTALVLDKNHILSSYGKLILSCSQDAAFTRDSVIARMTWRFGATALYPKHIAKVTIPVAK